MLRSSLLGITMVLLLIVTMPTDVNAQETTLGTLEYFYSDTNPLCKEQKNILDKWLEINKQKLNNVQIEMIDISNSAEISSRGYKANGVPYFQVKDSFGELIAEGKGLQSDVQLTNLINVLIKNHTEIVFTPGIKDYILNGKRISSDAETFIQNGYTYVPVRSLANSLGVSNDKISYSKETVVLKKGYITIQLKLNTKTMKINQTEYKIDAAPIMKKSRTYLPAKYVAEALGYKVKWQDKKVRINNVVNRVVSESIQYPTPIFTEEEDRYYDFVEILITGEINEEDMFFEKEDLLILKNGNYAGVLLTNDSNRIFLINKAGEYSKFELTSNLGTKGGKWVVKNEDVTKVGVLSSILKN